MRLLSIGGYAKRSALVKVISGEGVLGTQVPQTPHLELLPKARLPHGPSKMPVYMVVSASPRIMIDGPNVTVLSDRQPGLPGPPALTYAAYQKTQW